MSRGERIEFALGLFDSLEQAPEVNKIEKSTEIRSTIIARFLKTFPDPMSPKLETGISTAYTCIVGALKNSDALAMLNRTLGTRHTLQELTR